MRIFTIAVLIALSHLAYSNCQNDSTVVKFYKYSNYDTRKNITVSTFHLDSGTVDVCEKQQLNNQPWVNSACTTSFWSKTQSYIRANGLLDSAITKSGSLNGWVNTEAVFNTYNSSDLITSSTKAIWNNNTWTIDKVSFTNYDAQNRILEHYTVANNSGTMVNLNKEIYTYVNADLVRIVYQAGNGWANQKKYEFTYTGNIRTSLNYFIWDDSLQAWNSNGHFNYDNQFGPWAVCVKEVQSDTTGGILNSDTMYVVLDLNQNILVDHAVNVYGGPDFFSGDYSNHTYEYPNGVKCETSILESMVYYDLYSGDTMVSHDCATRVSYTYNSQGKLISWNDRSRCGNPRGSDGGQTYNSDGNIDHIYSEGWSMVSDWKTDTWYKYIGANHIALCIAPWDEEINTCKGVSVESNLITAGGCAPFHYQWIPSTGLSGDTIANPVIHITDTINYSITVTDNNGKISSVNVQVSPRNMPNIIMDTTSFAGSLAFLQTNYIPNASFQWYMNHQPVTNAHLTEFYPNTSGYYYVSVADWENQCTVNSDSVFVPDANNFLTVNSNTFTICQGENVTLTANGAVTYDWTPGNLNTATIDVIPSTSTTYTVYGTNSTGVVDTMYVEVIVNLMPDVNVTIAGNFLLSNQSNVHYQWIDCDNNMSILTNENDQGYVANTNGSYAVILDNNGCIDTSACYLIAPTNIIEENATDNLLYPNPVVSKLNYNSTNECRYTIIDYAGRIILNGDLNPGINTIDTEKLSPGLYFFFTLGSDYRCFRLMKE